MMAYDISKEVQHLYVECEGEATIEQLSFSDARSLRTLIVGRNYTIGQLEKPVDLGGSFKGSGDEWCIFSNMSWQPPTPTPSSCQRILR